MECIVQGIIETQVLALKGSFLLFNPLSAIRLSVAYIKMSDAFTVSLLVLCPEKGKIVLDFL